MQKQRNASSSAKPRRHPVTLLQLFPVGRSHFSLVHLPFLPEAVAVGHRHVPTVPPHTMSAFHLHRSPSSPPTWHSLCRFVAPISCATLPISPLPSVPAPATHVTTGRARPQLHSARPAAGGDSCRTCPCMRIGQRRPSGGWMSFPSRHFLRAQAGVACNKNRWLAAM